MQRPLPQLAVTPSLPAAERIASVDVLRGLVMVVMVLDHVRDLFHAQALMFDPVDLERTNPMLFATRWITHFCAPVFVFLAGTSAFLQQARGKSRGEVSRLLLTRGLWLILLELTVISFGWSFALDFLFLQVIWAIGWSMVALAALVWLPWQAVLGLGAAIVAGQHLLDPIDAADLGRFALLWGFLFERTPIVVDGRLWGFFFYPVVPWIGVMALGYGLGRLFTRPAAIRRRLLWSVGAGMVLAFLVLRASQVYGEPDGWRSHADPVWTAMDVLSTSKYPPSLLFVCMTIGPALIALPFLEQLKGRWREPWITFGAVPFFFYILHIYLVHGLSAAASLASGYPIWGVRDLFLDPGPIQGFGYPLAVVYLVWIGVVAALYLPCRWFAGLKRRHPGGWTSYL